jgi:biopolymer transport protein ExbD
MAARIDSGDEIDETHEINVTPFIDVMLVLLMAVVQRSEARHI